MDIKQEDEENDVIETAVFINPRPMHCDGMANSIEQVLKPEPSESSAAQFNEELGIKTECESSTLLTDLNIKREIDTDTSPKSRIKQEYSSMEEQDETALLSDRLVKSEKADGDMCEDRGKPQYIDFRQLSSKNSDSDVDRLNTETVYIKKECDTSFPQESIKHEDITIEKQDTSDPPASTNAVVKKEETISYVDILENMDTDDEDIDTATLQTELDIKDEEIPSNSAVKKKIGGKDQATRSNPEENFFSCYHCGYIFGRKHRLFKHMKVHENKKKTFGCDPSSSDSRGGRSCLHCNAIFKHQTTLNEHIARSHLNCNPSVTRKIRECTLCAFETTRISILKKHFLKHLEINTNHKFTTCTQCNVTFNEKMSWDDHILKKHPNFIATVTSKIYKCTKCTFATTMSSYLKKHLSTHSETTAIVTLHRCLHCTTTFKSKKSLDDHIVQKHPNFIASVASKIHKCTKCSYATTMSTNLKRHLSTHSETSAIGTLYTCRHCTATFRIKTSLDDHIGKKHPNFIASVTSKIHKCTKCTYVTTISSNLRRHLSTHSETSAMGTLFTCRHCTATFRMKISLDDHIVKKHPNFIAAVTSKIHKCTKCTFATTVSRDLKSHLSTHPEISAISTLSTCLHCTATFRNKISLDNHILKNHPHFVSSVTSKIHKCTKCTFATTISSSLKRHLSTHSETTAISHTCRHCSATFRLKISLDDHIVRKHPNFIASVTSKIHKCTKCTFQTTMITHFKRHSCNM